MPAGGGRDNIIGRKLDDYIDGGLGDDTLMGGKGHDYLRGGEGEDVAEFDKTWGQSKRKFSLDEGDVIARVEGTDRLQDIEFAQTKDGVKAPLAQWRYVVTRKDDGKATVQLFENDEEFSQSKGHYDDATPVPDGTNGALVRHNSGTPGYHQDGKKWVVELADQWSGATRPRPAPACPPQRTAGQAWRARTGRWVA